MLVRATSASSGGGGGEIIVAAIVKNQSQSESQINSDYVSVSSDSKTVTFLKKVKGIINTQSSAITNATITYTLLSNRRAYTSRIYEFEADVNETVTFPIDFTTDGYSIYCIDA